MFESFFSNLSMWVEAIVNAVVEIFNEIISFFKDMVGWFKEKINGIRTKVAYIITMIKLKRALDKLTNGNNKNIFEGAKEVTIDGLYGDDRKFSEGIAQAIYDEEKDKITEIRIIGNTKGGIDDDLRNIMKGHDVVKLV